MFSEAKPELIELTRDAVEVKKICKIKEASNMDSNKILFYLDKNKDGFSYGQLITPEICETFFSPDRWPRIASVSLNLQQIQDHHKARYDYHTSQIRRKRQN